jgi:outer membrane protein OmpA-like peptidoglycan-associated protein
LPAFQNQELPYRGDIGPLLDLNNSLIQMGTNLFDKADNIDSFLIKFRSAYIDRFGLPDGDTATESVTQVGRWVWEWLRAEKLQVSGDPVNKISNASRSVHFDSRLIINEVDFTDAIHWLQDLNLRPLCKITVSGYSDTSGSDQQNLDLSKQRAKLVADRLRSEFDHGGLSRSGVKQIDEVESWGERRLAFWTNDEVNELRNRRVEITVGCPTTG